MNENNAKTIDNYISKNPDSAVGKKLSVIISGESQDIQVYKIPLNLGRRCGVKKSLIFLFDTFDNS